MSVFDKIQRNIDKTIKGMRKSARELPFPEPVWLHDPVVVTTLLKEQYGKQFKGMIDTYQVGKEEIGTFLCTDREGRGTLSLGAECRGAPGWVAVKDCAPSRYPIGSFHTHPAEQPTHSVDDLRTSLAHLWISALGWRNNRGYWLKAVTLDTYYQISYEEQRRVDEDLAYAEILDREIGHLGFKDKELSMEYRKALEELIDVLGNIEERLGVHVVML